MSPRAAGKTPGPEESPSFEEALDRLEALVEELEAGDVPLEKSVAAFAEGQRLISFCEKKLQAAEQALRQIKGEADDALDAGTE